MATPGGATDLPPESERIPFAEVAGVLHGGRYRIEAEVGSGSAGTVYRARDVTSGATIALKIVGESSAAHRFTREATTLARLSHPAVVRYIAHGETQGRMFLAMEWLDGEDLETRLDHGKLGWEGACIVGLRIAEALAHAHGLGLVHRDLGPRNVFLPGRKLEQAKLLDFGLVRLIDPTVLERTASQAILGTPYYMSPEQIRSSKNVDARADLFSLGVLLYEMASGRRPFEGTELFSLWLNIIEATPPPLVVPGAPPELLVLIETLLKKDPAARPVSAQVVADLLREIGTAVVPTAPLAPPIATGPPAPRQLGSLVSVSAHPAQTTPPPLRSLPPADVSHRRRAGAIVAGIVVGASLAGAVAFALHRRPGSAKVVMTPPSIPSDAPRIVASASPPLDEPPPSDDEPPPVASPPSSTRPVRLRGTTRGVPSAPGTAGVPGSVDPMQPVAPPAPPGHGGAERQLICKSGQRIEEQGATYAPSAYAPGSPTVVAGGSCQLTLANCTIEGTNSVTVNERADVTLRNCTVRGRIILTSSGATVRLRNTTVQGQVSNNAGGTVDRQ